MTANIPLQRTRRMRRAAERSRQLASHMALSTLECEAILLHATYDAINEMVNHEVLHVSRTEGATVRFQSRTHSRFFYLVLTDFLSATDSGLPIPAKAFVRGLREISESPSFEIGGSAAQCRQAIHELTDWLNATIEVELHLATIGIEASLQLSRLEAIKLTGTLSKHNYLRARGVALQVKRLLTRAGLACDIETALKVLPDFYSRFQDDILLYHAGTVAYLLNEVR